MNNSTQQKEEHINSAYEALENMRKMNLQWQCHQRNVTYDDECCTPCLLSSDQPTRFPLSRLLPSSHRKRLQSSPPCLICGTHVCKQHASKAFSKEDLTVCLECEHLFGLHFVIDFLTEPKHEKRKQHLDHLLERYDRVVLLLTYSAQYIPRIAEQLEQSKERQNQIGLNTSRVGVLSGALGMAAAATILTPMGPPLLVASLLFGGGSTVVQTGSQAILYYYSEPQQLAKRILALHSMLWSILQIVSVLRDAMMREHVRSEFYNAEDPFELSALNTKKGVLFSAAGLTTVGRYSAVGAAEMSQAGSQSARFATRSSTNLLLGARLARFAGGAMSAVVLVMEARNIQETVEAIHAGNPCDKATRLREILTELDHDIPETSTLDRELHRYLDILNQREKVWTEEQVGDILFERDEREEELQEGEQMPETSSSSKSDNLSLFERIALFKQQEKETEETDDVSTDLHVSVANERESSQ